MKSFIFICLSFFTIQSVIAATPKQIAPCSQTQKLQLHNSINEWITEGYRNVNLIYNQQRQLLGYYAFDDNSGIHAKICELNLDPNLTIASEWYYWNSDIRSSNPSSWRAGETFELQQDEGIASIKVQKKSSSGNLLVEFKVIGWNENSHEVTARKEIVSFVPQK